MTQNKSQAEASDADTLLQLGLTAVQASNTERAIDLIFQAAKLKPKYVVNLIALADSLLKNPSLLESGEALRLGRVILEHAININPKISDAYLMLAGIEISSGNFTGAIDPLNTAISLKPSEPGAYGNIIYTLRMAGRAEEALPYARKLLRIAPDNPESYQHMGRLLIEIGNIDEAQRNLEKAIQLDSSYGQAYYDLTSIKKFSATDDNFISQIEKSLKLGMKPLQRSYIHFALGKIYDDRKEHEKAFEHYKQGNTLSKPAIEENTDYLRLKKTRNAYSMKNIRQLSSMGNDSDIPVFVVGMPRSGTTLIEQIISAHADAAGAGELTEIGKIEKQIVPQDKLGQYTYELIKNLNRETINRHADHYLTVLTRTNKNAKRIVDKLPDNYRHLGLITILFPRSHIIHSIRNPLDTCLSCYFQPFSFLPWTHDLNAIAKRYRSYREIMAFWKETLPAGKIIDSHYEELTKDPENQSRRLIESCDLTWDTKCLEFYKSERSINTASLWQARQPIYSTSRKRWIPYAKYIKSLAQELVEYLSDEDIEEFARQGIKLKSGWRLHWW